MPLFLLKHVALNLILVFSISHHHRAAQLLKSLFSHRKYCRFSLFLRHLRHLRLLCVMPHFISQLLIHYHVT